MTVIGFGNSNRLGRRIVVVGSVGFESPSSGLEQCVGDVDTFSVKNLGKVDGDPFSNAAGFVTW